MSPFGIYPQERCLDSAPTPDQEGCHSWKNLLRPADNQFGRGPNALSDLVLFEELEIQSFCLHGFSFYEVNP